MDDDYDAVRFIAHRSLKQIGGYDDVEFDFVVPSSERQQPSRRILERWSKQVGTLSVHNPSVLVNREGKLDQATFDMLLQIRDRSSVSLNE